MTGYKLCGSPHHEGRRWLPVSYFYVARRRPNGEIAHLHSYCQTCQRIHVRKERGFQARQPSKIRVKTGPNGYAPKTPEEQERLRTYRRQKYAEWIAEHREDRREYWRIRAEAKRREKGIPPRNFKNRKTVVRAPGVLARTGKEVLDPKPLVDYLNANEIKHLSGISTEHLERIKKGHTLTLDYADRICIALEDPMLLNELYPC